MKCPCGECNSEPVEHVLQEIMDEETYLKLKKFQLREKVLKDPKLIFCSNNECDGYLNLEDDPDDIKLTCAKCEQATCRKCK